MVLNELKEGHCILLLLFCSEHSEAGGDGGLRGAVTADWGRHKERGQAIPYRYHSLLRVNY